MFLYSKKKKKKPETIQVSIHSGIDKTTQTTLRNNNKGESQAHESTF